MSKSAIDRENERYRREQAERRAERDRKEAAYRAAASGESGESCLVMAPVIVGKLAWSALKRKVGMQ